MAAPTTRVLEKRPEFLSRKRRGETHLGNNFPMQRADSRSCPRTGGAAASRCDFIFSSTAPREEREKRSSTDQKSCPLAAGSSSLQHKGNLTQFSPGRVGAACFIQPCAAGTLTAETPFQPAGLHGHGVGENNRSALEASSALCVPLEHPSTEYHRSYTILKLSGPDGTRSDPVTGAQDVNLNTRTY